MVELTTFAEQKAEAATLLPCFPVNLPDVKRSVAAILSQFGKGLMFHEYTAHDISHVEDMLSTLEWIIPKATKKELTKAEWLMIVLSIYFHDMGLVVTEEEYNKRSASGFQSFCDSEVFGGVYGAEYRAKLSQLAEGERDRFLYQEFVRANHARRVRSWIDGVVVPELGYASAQIVQISSLLSSLDQQFKRGFRSYMRKSQPR